MSVVTRMHYLAKEHPLLSACQMTGKPSVLITSSEMWSKLENSMSVIRMKIVWEWSEERTRTWDLQHLSVGDPGIYNT